jgi:uncharacterized protein (TIGR00251 family)
MKIKVKVITQAKQSKIEEIGPNGLRIKLKSAPIKGKANKELVKLLADYYQVPKSRVEILKGQKAKDKVV